MVYLIQSNQIQSVYAVEIAGACNLEAQCPQCPMHTRPRYRKRGLMSDDTVARSLYYVERLRENHETLHLHVFGEPLLHPKFDEHAAKFAKLMPISVSTNGVLLDEKWADRLAKIPWAWITVSPWDGEAMIRAGRLLEERKIPTRYQTQVSHNWAGQSKDGPAGKKLFSGCPFLARRKCVIRWDGSLATCCISDREEDTIGHISAEPETIEVRSYSLCDTCHHARGG